MQSIICAHAQGCSRPISRDIYGTQSMAVSPYKQLVNCITAACIQQGIC